MSDTDTPTTLDRRRFLTVVGGTSAGAAVLSGCSTDRVQKLVPYLVQSEDQIPGLPTYYASTCTECAAGCGVHVKTREGRAIKLEGNPDHPVNAGTLCARGSAALQGLYNPGRVKGPMVKSGGSWKEISWDEAVSTLAQKLGGAQGKLAVINGAGRGTFSDLLAQWTTALGGTVAAYEPFDFAPVRQASKLVFGRDEIPGHDFASAKYILSFGADFLETWLAPVEQQRGWAAPRGGGDTPKHVYFAPRASLTGLNADDWQAITPGSEAILALAIAKVVASTRGAMDAGVQGLLGAVSVEQAAKASGVPAATIEKIAKEFAAASPSLAVAGGVGAQAPNAVEACAAVAILNYVAGNVGHTVLYGADLQGGAGTAALDTLVDGMAAGSYQVALVHEANPIGTLPKARGFAEAFAKVPFKVSTSLFHDETTAQCDLLIPNHHALERWDDVRPRAGVVGLMQPVMEPVFKTRHTGDVLLQTAKKVGGPLSAIAAADFRSHLEAQWKAVATARKAEPAGFWREALRNGGLYEKVAPAPVKLAAASLTASEPKLPGAGEFTFVAYASPMYYDGRGANRPWLLENPDPVTKITWHPWIEVHPDTAKELNVREGEHLVITTPAGKIEAPAYIYPGIAKGIVSAPLGLGQGAYGFFAAGHFGRDGRGVNALDLLPTSKGQGFQTYVTKCSVVRNASGYTRVAKTEGNSRQLGRHIAEAMPVAHAAKGLTVKQSYEALGGHEHEVNTERELEALQGWREGQVGTKDGEGRKLGNYAGEHAMWGMAVDLARCTGCSACVTACYAENNIAVVGEEQVTRGREMSWMRIERYWEGGEDGEPVEARFVPVMCQHCDNAPCEPVCPVYAAYHTPDGLNGQVYNRCVGTRYCANNCPYKVRYFNWLKYNESSFPEPLQLQLSPEVTVRARGVMEKCTFCIQRIRGAQHSAKLEDRQLKDGEIMTACQQACPSGALTFGDMNLAGSKVNTAKGDHRGYHILEDLNVRPAVTYLAKVTHRELAVAVGHGAAAAEGQSAGGHAEGGH